MATIKLKKPADPASGTPGHPAPSRGPVRGRGGPRERPTLAQAQAERAEREARHQEQLRQRFGDRPPDSFTRRDERPQMPRPPSRPAPSSPAPRPDARPTSRSHRPGTPNTPNRAFNPPPSARHRSQQDDDDHAQPAAHAPGSMRLSKRMSELGIASRREADEWIAKGWVRVDDQVVSELGSRVVPGQRVTVDAKAKYQQAQRVTVLINKPVGIVSGQAEDGYEPALVLVTPQNLWREDRSGIRFLREHLRSLVPAGRLDIDSVGLLVLTQDGRVAKQLIGEDSEVEKEYLVRVAYAAAHDDASDGSVSSPHTAVPARAQVPEVSLTLLRHGLELDGEALRPAQVEWVNDDQLRFVLRQGKKRQIRRMCETVGLQVLGLKRVRIGGVMLGDLPMGQWRYLRADEAF